ncbi:hypothetical protein [Frankia sp. Cas3]|uniref:hypothetical protein n=1 Tax=Frankia sp. Cas3 TaxID=3073926 RepID=UPI002AD2AF87|nr:hypothetical protein [Frankia sp. Cas3]
MTKTGRTETKAINAELRELRRDRKEWLTGKRLHWGQPWCTGPGSPHHQSAVSDELLCEGCTTVDWCRECAAEIEVRIDVLVARLNPLEGVTVPATAGPQQPTLF